MELVFVDHYFRKFLTSFDVNKILKKKLPTRSEKLGRKNENFQNLAHSFVNTTSKVFLRSSQWWITLVIMSAMPVIHSNKFSLFRKKSNHFQVIGVISNFRAQIQEKPRSSWASAPQLIRSVFDPLNVIDIVNITYIGTLLPMGSVAIYLSVKTDLHWYFRWVFNSMTLTVFRKLCES